MQPKVPKPPYSNLGAQNPNPPSPPFREVDCTTLKWWSSNLYVKCSYFRKSIPNVIKRTINLCWKNRFVNVLTKWLGVETRNFTQSASRKGVSLQLHPVAPNPFHTPPYVCHNIKNQQKINNDHHLRTNRESMCWVSLFKVYLVNKPRFNQIWNGTVWLLWLPVYRALLSAFCTVKYCSMNAIFSHHFFSGEIIDY